MNLDELRAVQDREREKDSLQHLRDSFYEEVGTYIADLRAERERRAEQADDPFADPEVRRLTDEIETAEEVAESIYERRMGKVVKTASLAAAGYTADTEGLTEEESDLFDDLVERIEANQDTVLDVLSGRREAARADSVGEAGAAASGDGAAAGGDGVAADDNVAPDDGAIAGHDGASLDGDRTVDAASGDGSVDAVSSDGDAPDELGPPPGVDSPSRDGDAAASGPSAGEPADPAAAGGDGATAADSSASGASAAGDESTAAVDGDGAASAVEADGELPEDGDVAGGFDAAAAMGDPDRVTVRITDDVGEIVGVDGTAYDLATDDVVTLPEANAEPLLEKDAATRVE